MSERIQSSSVEGASNTHAQDAASAVSKTSARRSGAASTETSDAANGVTLRGIESVPDLIEALRCKEYNRSIVAVKALVKIGGAAVPALVEAMKDDGTCWFATIALRRLRMDAVFAVPGLIEKLRNGRDRSVQRHAADVLSALGPVSEDAVSALATSLENDELEVRCIAAEALGRIGEEANEAGPILRATTRFGDPALRAKAALALGQIGAATKASAPSLIRALGDDDYDIRVQAVGALAKIGPVSDGVIPALVEALHDSDCDVHEAAERALSSVGVKAPMRTIPQLLEVTPRNDDSIAQYCAFDALRRIGLLAVPGLIEALKNPSRDTRQLAAGTLADIGPSAIDAVPALTKAPEDEDAEARGTAAYPLRRINGMKAVTR